jgi:hypothetical protein
MCCTTAERGEVCQDRPWILQDSSLHWIGTKLCDPPKYDGLNNIEYFIHVSELKIPKKYRLLALDVVLKATLAKWWVAHKEGMED